MNEFMINENEFSLKICYKFRIRKISSAFYETMKKNLIPLKGRVLKKIDLNLSCLKLKLFI